MALNRWTNKWNTVSSIQWNTTRPRKGVKPRFTLQQGWISKMLCWVDARRYKRPHPVWFHFYEMFRKGKSSETEGKWAAGRERRNGNDSQWEWGVFWGDENVLALDRGDGYTTVTIINTLNYTLEEGEIYGTLLYCNKIIYQLLKSTQNIWHPTLRQKSVNLKLLGN